MSITLTTHIKDVTNTRTSAGRKILAEIGSDILLCRKGKKKSKKKKRKKPEEATPVELDVENPSLSEEPNGPNPRDFLTTLPNDVIRCITDHTNISDQYILARTNRRLQQAVIPEGHLNIIRLWTRQQKENLSYPGLDYLWRISKNDPAKFVCETCLKVHRLPRRSSSADPIKQKLCAAKWQRVFQTGGRMGHVGLARNHFEVQMCLKWDRMIREDTLPARQCLAYERLLRPRTAKFKHLCSEARGRGFAIVKWLQETPTTVTTEPRIINGRYNLRTTWVYTPTLLSRPPPDPERPDPLYEYRYVRDRLIAGNIADLQICPHQFHSLSRNAIDQLEDMTGFRIETSRRRHRLLPRLSDGELPFGDELALDETASVRSLSRSIDGGMVDLLALYSSLPVSIKQMAFQHSIFHASKRPNHPVNGSCMSCLTDWSVEYCSGSSKAFKIKLVVWQDLGGEGSSQNQDWRSQVVNMDAKEIEKARLRRTTKGDVRMAWDPSEPFDTLYFD